MSGILSEVGETVRTVIYQLFILAIAVWTGYCAYSYLDLAQGFYRLVGELSGSDFDREVYQVTERYSAFIMLLLWSIPTSALTGLALLVRPRPSRSALPDPARPRRAPRLSDAGQSRDQDAGRRTSARRSLRRP